MESDGAMAAHNSSLPAVGPGGGGVEGLSVEELVALAEVAACITTAATSGPDGAGGECAGRVRGGGRGGGRTFALASPWAWAVVTGEGDEGIEDSARSTAEDPPDLGAGYAPEGTIAHPTPSPTSVSPPKAPEAVGKAASMSSSLSQSTSSTSSSSSSSALVDAGRGGKLAKDGVDDSARRDAGVGGGEGSQAPSCSDHGYGCELQGAPLIAPRGGVDRPQNRHGKVYQGVGSADP